ncbi:MAG: hypothetical protein R3Y36_01655 [Spirochaetales bacterium]
MKKIIMLVILANALWSVVAQDSFTDNATCVPVAETAHENIDANIFRSVSFSLPYINSKYTAESALHTMMPLSSIVDILEHNYAQCVKNKKIAGGVWIGGLFLTASGFLFGGPNIGMYILPIGGAIAVAGIIADIVISVKQANIKETLDKEYGVQVAFNPIFQPVYAPYSYGLNWNVGGSLKVSL